MVILSVGDNGVDMTISPALIVTILVILLSIVFFIYKSFSGSSKKQILFIGLCESGKTTLFTRVVLGAYRDTYTSIKENVSDYPLDNDGVVKLVDIPGHERLRGHIIDQYKGSTRDIVFVVDANTVQKEIRDVAELLFTVLTDPVIRSHCRRILIFCNKQDNPTAKGARVIQPLLEKELSVVRHTKTSLVGNISPGDAVTPVALGFPNKEFAFDQLSSPAVSFAEGFAAQNKADDTSDISELTSWMKSFSK